MILDTVMEWISAIAAVGLAAMGLVEALKVLKIPFTTLSLATIGLGTVKKQLGRAAMDALVSVYGPGAGTVLLEGAWRKGAEGFATTLRNGLRMAVFSSGGERLISSLGQNADETAAAVKALRAGGKSPAAAGPDVNLDDERERVARLEAAIDARVDAAVASGQDKYAASMQCVASILAIAGCLLMSQVLPEDIRPNVGTALLVGLLAVPVAPVAKDLVGFLSSLRTSFGKAKAGA